MLAAHGLSLRLGATAALQDVTTELRRGEITAICGPNGAGKSTLLSCLAGLLLPDTGVVMLDGAALTGIAPRNRARAIGYLPQHGTIAWDLSVRNLVALGRLPHGDAAAAGGAEVVERTLAALDLAALAERPVSALSGGERARALFGRVLAGEPRWILADEPLAALDLAHQLAMLARLREAARLGTGVVLVLHDLTLAMNHADRVLVLSDGELRKDGPPEQALSRSAIREVWGVDAQWLGEPGARALSAF